MRVWGPGLVCVTAEASVDHGVTGLNLNDAPSLSRTSPRRHPSARDRDMLFGPQGQTSSIFGKKFEIHAESAKSHLTIGRWVSL